MKTQTKIQKCMRLRYKSHDEQPEASIILGIVISDEDGFIKFQTAKREYLISKRLVQSMEETDIIFKGVSQ